MPEDVPGRRTDEAPGLVVEAEQTLVAQALPADALVGHHGLHAALPRPLKLPVGPAAHGPAAQHLRPVVEALGVVRLSLVLIGGCSLQVALGQAQTLVSRIGIQR